MKTTVRRYGPADVTDGGTFVTLDVISEFCTAPELRQLVALLLANTNMIC